MSDERRALYRVLAVRKAAYGPHSPYALWSVDVQEQAVANAPTLTLQVESAVQPYPLGAVIPLCRDWIMTPDKDVPTP